MFGRGWNLFIVCLLLYVLDLPITHMRVYLCNLDFILFYSIHVKLSFIDESAKGTEMTDFLRN